MVMVNLRTISLILNRLIRILNTCTAVFSMKKHTQGLDVFYGGSGGNRTHMPYGQGF